MIYICFQITTGHLDLKKTAFLFIKKNLQKFFEQHLKQIQLITRLLIENDDKVSLNVETCVDLTCQNRNSMLVFNSYLKNIYIV